MTLIWLGLGGLLGAIIFAGQWWSVRRLDPDAPRQSLVTMASGLGLRWLLVAALFLAALGQGAGPALLVLAGMWLTRWLLLIWWEFRDKLEG